MEMYSGDAVAFIMLIAAKESGLGRYMRQLKGGPARGLLQMEPFTHNSVWDTFLYRYPRLINYIQRQVTPWFEADEMDGNAEYAIVMGRAYIRSWPDAIPHAGDIQGMAELWKRKWNTPGGLGTVEEAIAAYKRLCL